MIATSLLLALAAATQPVSSQVAPSTAGTTRDKLVCKRFSETGSLVKKRKVCHTKAQWGRLRSDTQDEWGALQGIKGSTNGR